MKHIKSTAEYLFSIEKGKRFFYLFLITLPLGLLFSIEMPIGNFISWINEFGVGQNFSKVFMLFGSFNITGYLLTAFIGIFAVAILSTVVSRSLRMGRFYIDNLLRETNESFFPSLYICLITLGLYLLLKTLNSSFLYLWQLIPNEILSLVLTIISLIVMYFSFMIIVTMTIMALPIMVFKGVRPYIAIGESIKKTSKEFFKIFLAIILPISVCFVVGVLISLIKATIISLIVDTILYSFAICYIVALSFISFFNVENFTRIDIPRNYYFKR